MTQRIIVIHGRSTKPAKKAHARLQERALLDGIDRVDPIKAARIRSGKVKLNFVYYGDINNALLAEVSKKHLRDMTERDPDCGDAPCIPATGYIDAIDRLKAIRRFDKRAYRKTIASNKDLRFIDDAAKAVSTLAAISTATFLNTFAIKLATADMGAYLMTRKYGSEIRERLQGPLKRAIRAGDDICLLSHSMGCIVAYDVMWKFSRMSEYRDLQKTDFAVARWVTLGCPLGEAGVKSNLYDSSERGPDRFPKKFARHWINVAAVDDFICHDATMRGDYADMRRMGYVEDIRDLRIYNCYAKDGTSNPHKLYGYLAHPVVANAMAEWID